MKGKKSGWKKKVPQNLVALIEDAQQLRLYLINQNGPETSFVYCDDDQRKFKITIGETIFCSCSSTNQGHCVHTLHAMIKKFRVDPDNPIIWQDGYSDSEVTDLISGKFSIRKLPPPLPVHDNSQEQQQFKMEEHTQAQRQEVNEDSLCPICQESMNQLEALTFCKKMCGNNFHIKCLKIWVEQKQGTVTCPMCRQSLGLNARGDILREEFEFVNRVQTHKEQCKGCQMKPIVGGIYQCLHCKSQTICQKCFHTRQYHSEHNDYFHRVRTDDEWKPYRRIPQPYALKKEADMSIKEFIESCFQTQDIVQQQNQNLLVIGSVFSQEKKKCDLCQQPNIMNKQTCKTILKSLKCGHLIDAACFKKLEENNYICPLDGVIQAEGYIKINGIKPKSFVKQLDSKIKPPNGLTKPPIMQLKHIDTPNQTSLLMVGLSPGYNVKVNKNDTRQRQLNREKASQGRLKSLQPLGFQPSLDLNINGVGRFQEKSSSKLASKANNSFKIKRSSMKVDRISSHNSQQMDKVNLQGRFNNVLSSDEDDFRPYNQHDQ